MSAKNNTQNKKAGCSCSRTGGCSCGVSGCSCGGAGCGSCQMQGFVRPRFFAGQLLVEEDLELINTYVTGKNRLHNRALFGPGVVCGLQVTCDPCGGGGVNVEPGYALDCCGNDIVLSCAQKLDIPAMVRQFRQDQLGGADCTEPCPQPCKEDTDGVAARRKNDPLRHYCLYIRYCEEGTDPIAPYATQDPCGSASACETSRVREGFRFELRCPPVATVPDDIFSRFKGCLGDVRRTKEITDAAPTLQHTLQTVRLALDGIRQETIRVDNKPTQDLIARWTKIITQLNTDLGAKAHTDPDSLDAQLKEDLGLSELTRDLAVSLIGKADEVAGLAVRAILYSGIIGWLFLNQRMDPDLQVALTALDRTRQGIIAGTLNNADAFLAASDLSKITVPIEIDWKDASLDRIKWALTYTNKVDPNGNPPSPLSASQELLAYGATYTPKLHNQLRSLLWRIRDILLYRTDSGAVSDCRLPQQVSTQQMPRRVIDSNDDDLVLSDAKDFLRDGQQVVNESLRVFLDCICAAINPTCQTCTDTGVLLACIDVKGCEVVDVCNLERMFVLSPTALRQWVPLFGLFGDLIEAICCRLRRVLIGEDGQDDPTTGLQAMVQRLFGGSDQTPAAVPDFVERIFTSYVIPRYSPHREWSEVSKIGADLRDVISARLDYALHPGKGISLARAWRPKSAPQTEAVAPQPNDALLRRLDSLESEVKGLKAANQDLIARLQSATASIDQLSAKKKQ